MEATFLSHAALGRYQSRAEIRVAKTVTHARCLLLFDNLQVDEVEAIQFLFDIVSGCYVRWLIAT